MKAFLKQVAIITLLTVNRDTYFVQVMIVETADELRTLATKHLDQLLAAGAPSHFKWEDRVPCSTGVKG